MNIESLNAFEFEGQKFEAKHENDEGMTVTTVYACDNFFGYPVTIAEKVSASIPKENLIINYTFRATVCGKNDPYTESTGVNIAIGRIQQADEPDIVIGSSMEHGQSVTSAAKEFTKIKLERLKEYIMAKKSSERHIEERKQLNHKILGRRFEEFK